MPGRVPMIEILVDDPTKGREFYGGLFRWHLLV
jgi:predicted enzyme related to lactoylglutathione lyase